MVKRGEVWLTALDPTVGSEIRKTRPCIVVSPDELNAKLRTVIMVPMTTGSRIAPFRVAITFRGKAGLAVPDHARSVDRRRCIKNLGSLDASSLLKLLRVLRELFKE